MGKLSKEISVGDIIINGTIEKLKNGKIEITYILIHVDTKKTISKKTFLLNDINLIEERSSVVLKRIKKEAIKYNNSLKNKGKYNICPCGKQFLFFPLK